MTNTATGTEPRSETRHFDFTRREVARCKKCKVGYQRTVRVKGYRTTYFATGHVHRFSETLTEDGRHISHAPHDCPTCKRRLCFEPVKGRVVPEIKCGSKCQGAHGPSCDCSCGGKNHGAGCSTI